MSDHSALSTLITALEKNYAASCAKNGVETGISFFAERFDSETVIKLAYDEDAAKSVKPYIIRLKKQFGYIADGEGEEFAVDLVIPTARVKDMAEALENPGKTQLAKDFKTVAFTGTLTTSRAAAVKKAEAAGFGVAKAVSKNVDYVVAGDNPGAKADKAHDLGIPVLSEVQWAKLLKKSGPK